MKTETAQTDSHVDLKYLKKEICNLVRHGFTMQEALDTIRGEWDLKPETVAELKGLYTELE